MKFNLLFFGLAKEIIGESSMKMCFNNPISVRELRDFVETNYPRLKAIESYAIAINRTYAHNEDVIQESDEVAIIPPVSGG